MARDIKLNKYQLTVAQLKRKCAQYIEDLGLNESE
jgi:hypothetical protein